MRIEDEIKQEAFRDHKIKLDVNIMYTASWLSQIKTDALKPFDLTWQQFNILRILKGQHPKPASVKLLRQRMIDRTSNASRLVEKLRKKGLVERRTCPDDRRKVDVLIADKGMHELQNASHALETAIQKQISHLTEEEIDQINSLLDKMRS